MQARGYFITGTDTGVGKTFVTAAIAAVLKEKGVNVGVMKPVETGCPEKDGTLEPQDALYLKNAAGVSDELDLINPYRFKAPLAPSIASRLEGKNIDLNMIKECYDTLASKHSMMFVEGAGGLLTPLNENETVADLAKVLQLPLIVIAESRLGTINHTLLTVKHAQSIGIEVKGIIINYPALATDETLSANQTEIKRLTNIPVLGELPFCDMDRASKMIKKYLRLSILEQ
ncbi:MAG: dethiobiotin synthase [Deltaproteobacteria bacterium]|nr:dethiobiotin synthase [Deltaproteobacteria bacterium]